MAIKITFHSHKGGCGKTMLTYSSSVYLAKHNYKVLCIDADTQGSLSNIFSHTWTKKVTQDENTGKDVFWEIENTLKLDGVATKDIFERDLDLDNLNILKTTHGVDLIFIEPNDFGAINQINNQINVARFIRQLNSIADRWDFIFIDLPPTAIEHVVSLLGSVDYIVCPQTVAANICAISGEIMLLNGINGSDKLLGVVLNQLEKKSKEHFYAERGLRNALGPKIFSSTIKHSTTIDTSVARNMEISKVPGGNQASKDITAVVEEMLYRIYTKQAKDICEGRFIGTDIEKNRVIDFIRSQRKGN